MNGIIIGKRVKVGAVFTSIAGVFAHFWPEHASAFIGMAVPLTFAVQAWIAKKFGVTSS